MWGHTNTRVSPAPLTPVRREWLIAAMTFVTRRLEQPSLQHLEPPPLELRAEI